MSIEKAKKIRTPRLRLRSRGGVWNTAIKLVVFLLLAGVIYRQIIARENIEQLWSAFRESTTASSWPWLALALLLMPLNWAFETQKWRVLIQNFEVLSFGRACRAVLSRVTLSLFTPKREGEYGGRILFLRPEHNWQGVIATLVGSYAQLLVLLGAGLMGTLYFAQAHQLLEALFLPLLFFLGLGLIGLLLFCFFNIDLIVPIAKRIPLLYRFRRFLKHVRLLESYSTEELVRALRFAGLRYATYALQYYLFIRFFGIEVPPLEGMAGIATIFLFQTSIPLPPLMGLLVRGKVALFVWGLYSANEIAILAATFGLWILNLILPALVGTAFMLKINVLKSLGYEKKNA